MKTLQSAQRCTGIARREAIAIGGLSAFGVGPHLLTSAATSSQAGDSAPRVGAARNCVLIWLDGGPSHLETFDVKPDAPAETRGPLKSIETAVAGYRVSECLPLTAARMNQVAVIRSMTSPLGEHNLGTHYVLSGYRPTPVLEYPSFHAVGAFHREADTLPGSVAIPDYRVGGSGFDGAGFLPPRYRPFSIDSDPARADFAVRNLTPSTGLSLDRLERRRQFVRQIEQHARTRGQRPSDSSSDFDRAFDMITSPEVRRAFRLEEEPTPVRQRYGLRTVGQSCLLARRLVQAGVSFVTVNHRGWDTHENIYTRLLEGYTGAREPVGLIPTLDQAFAALLDDLSDCGLIDETLLVVAGEFGRTPKLNARAGRDHWPRAFSVLLAGGGIRGGQIIGQTDRTGEAPVDEPVTPGDLVRTIYTALGIDPDREIRTADGRPVRLAASDTRVIPGLW